MKRSWRSRRSQSPSACPAATASRCRYVIRLFEDLSRHRYVPPYAPALVHAGLNDRDAALACLERACEARDVHVVFLTVDPKWDTYRTWPAFQTILDRCNFARSNGPNPV